MIANNGWNYFTMPSCVAPGDYLMRVELIALHSAYAAGQAQFYMECAQINLTGGGSGTPGPTVKIPGYLSASSPAINYNKWTNAPKPYVMPAPKPWAG